MNLNSHKIHLIVKVEDNQAKNLEPQATFVDERLERSSFEAISFETHNNNEASRPFVQRKTTTQNETRTMTVRCVHHTYYNGFMLCWLA